MPLEPERLHPLGDVGLTQAHPGALRPHVGDDHLCEGVNTGLIHDLIESYMECVCK
jgi:hypothetical protein